MKGICKLKEKSKMLLPWLAFLLPYTFAMRGTDWSMMMHPDEPAILRPMQRFYVDSSPSVSSTIVYPEGFFVVTEAYRRAIKPIEFLKDRMAQEGSEHRDLDYIRAPIIRRGAPSIYIGRRANALMAGLCGLFIFLAVRVATKSAAGGLCASMLVACSPFLVEHAHYCETDPPFCAAMSFALLAYFSSIRSGSLRWAVVGVAASVGAFACKYTVAPLVPFSMAVYISISVKLINSAKSQDERRRALRRCVLAAFLSVIAAIATYAVFTPLFRTDIKQWAGNIFNVYGQAHGETSERDLAFQGGIPFIRLRYIFRLIVVQCLALGSVRMVLAILSSVWLLLRRHQNPCGVWLVLLLIFFFFFDLAVMPWVRSQEFLPIAILLGTLSALAIGEICRELGRVKVARYVVPLLCLCVAVLAYGSASRATTMFTTEDTRNAMRHWLEQSASPEAVFAAGRFASPALRYGRIKTADKFGEAEILWRPGAATPEHSYFARQSHFLGRGFVDVSTGERRPDIAAGWTNFLAHAILLREWKTTPGYQTTFSMLPMELWGIIPDGAEFALPKPLSPRATAYRMGPEFYDAAQGGDWLGSIDAIRTVGSRKRVRFVPPSNGAPLYAVTRHVDGAIPAKIKWEGCFEPRETVIAPGKADWFLYKPSLFDGWGDIYVRTRVRMRGDDQTSLCLTTITSDPAFAAELLTRGGAPDKAKELLAHAGLPTELSTAIAMSVKPLPKKFYTDFARIRFGDFTIYPGSNSIVNDNGIAAAGTTVELDSEFPVLFEAGHYTISFRMPLYNGQQPPPLCVKGISFTKATTQKIVAGGSFAPGKIVKMELDFSETVCPRICGTVIPSIDGVPSVTLEDFSIEWNPELSSAETSMRRGNKDQP